MPYHDHSLIRTILMLSGLGKPVAKHFRVAEQRPCNCDRYSNVIKFIKYVSVRVTNCKCTIENCL